jgi:hypothetical protein
MNIAAMELKMITPWYHSFLVRFMMFLPWNLSMFNAPSSKAKFETPTTHFPSRLVNAGPPGIGMKNSKKI